MRRGNLIRDKYNVGVGMMQLYAFTSGMRWDPMLKREIMTHSAVKGATMRYHFGNAGKTLVCGRRYMTRIFSRDDRMEMAMASRECPNSKAWMDAQSALANTFERMVYNAGLREQYEALDSRGASADFGHVRLLVYELAGRRGFTLSSGDRQVSFICTDEEDARMGLMSLDGLSLRDARPFVVTVAAGLAIGIRLTADDEVGLG